MEVKSGKMGKSLDFGSKNYPATCLPELSCYSNHFSPNTYLSSFPLTSRAAYPPIHQCRKPSYLPTYLPTYLASNPLTNLPTYLPTQLPTCQPTYIPTYRPTNLRIYVPIYPPT